VRNSKNWEDFQHNNSIQNTTGIILRKMKPKQELRDKPRYINRIPFKCGREYIGEINRRLDVGINKYKYKVTRLFLIDTICCKFF
jgi:hypothetical protein